MDCSASALWALRCWSACSVEGHCLPTTGQQPGSSFERRIWSQVLGEENNTNRERQPRSTNHNRGSALLSSRASSAGPSDTLGCWAPEPRWWGSQGGERRGERLDAADMGQSEGLRRLTVRASFAHRLVGGRVAHALVLAADPLAAWLVPFKVKPPQLASRPAGSSANGTAPSPGRTTR